MRQFTESRSSTGCESVSLVVCLCIYSTVSTGPGEVVMCFHREDDGCEDLKPAGAPGSLSLAHGHISDGTMWICLGPDWQILSEGSAHWLGWPNVTIQGHFHYLKSVYLIGQVFLLALLNKGFSLPEAFSFFLITSH